jgi:glucosamine 6-phosphate synthetase-like amidotransferase/phosphosugar isomerase protein
LNELEAGATPPQGQDLGQGDGTGSGDGDQREFMEIAREIKDRDKCTMAVAMKKAVREYPDAHKKFLQANHKAEDDGRS